MYGRCDVIKRIEHPDLFDHRAVTGNESAVNIRRAIRSPAGERYGLKKELLWKIKKAWMTTASASLTSKRVVHMGK